MDKHFPARSEDDEIEDDEIYDPWPCLTLDEMLLISKGDFKIKVPMSDNTQLPAEVLADIELKAEHEAALHFHPIYSPDQNTACRICYRNGAKEYATNLHDLKQVLLDEAVDAEYGFDDKSKLQAKCDKYEAALKVVRNWKLPATGKFWDTEQSRPMSYEACFGSNGARDFMRNVANEALSAGEEKTDKAKEGVVRLLLSHAEEVSKDMESAKEYLESEGVDMTKLENDIKFIAWLAELAKLLHGAADGQPIKINQDEARKWFADGMTAYQCFRETWNME
jgi:hypothetical protein